MNVTALLFDCEDPPEFAVDEFPMVSLYALLQVEGEYVVYVPETKQILRGAEGLEFIAQIAPIAKFRGAGQADINYEEG